MLSDYACRLALRHGRIAIPLRVFFVDAFIYFLPFSFLRFFFFFFQAEDGIRDLTVTGVQTCALPIFGARLGENQRAMLEVQREQPDLSWDARTRILPPETAGDHQVEHQTGLALGFEHNPLTETMQVDNPAALDRGQRRVDRSEKEGGSEAHGAHLVTNDARTQRVEV